MIEYPVIVVYLALSSDVAKKRKKESLVVFSWRWSEVECSCPYKVKYAAI